MSADAADDRRRDSEAILDRLQRWYQVPLLAAVLGAMLWFRTRAFDEFVRDDTVLFSGNDAYYHYRATSYSVEHWPRQLYGDAWTHFPYGNNVGNFGSLMDQTVATVALVVGLGDPSARQIAIVAVLAPAVIATLAALLLYYMGTKLTGHRIGGITAAAVLAFVPQPSWVTRTTVGFYDHHVAESFMMAAAVLAMLHALTTVRRERPVFEQIQDRDWTGLRPTIQSSAIAGLVAGLYIHVWAPGIVIAGIFGFFFLLAMCLHVVRGESPEHLGFAGVISMTVAALTIVPWALSLEFSNASISLLHVLLFLGVALGCGIIAGLARYWDQEGMDPFVFPAAVGTLVVVGFAGLWLLLPEAFTSIESGLSRVAPIGQTETTLTVSEAQPTGWDNFGEKFYDWYGFTFFTALAGGLVMLARATLSDRPRSEYVLVSVWFAFVFSMAMAQVRFHYYLVLAVALLNGYLVVEIVRIASFPSLTAVEDIQAYHVLTVFAVIMLLIVPIASPIAVTTAADQSTEAGPSGVVWNENLDWMSENTPEPGTYGGADNEMSYYGPYDEIDDYEYPEGAYGVMSWWDYGHWITVQGERIPNANPFQQGPRAASAYFQAGNETRANMYLEALPALDGGSGLDNMSSTELQETIDSRTEQEASEETRYVMIDDQMASTKFSALTEWAGADYGDYFGSEQYQIGEQNTSLPVTNERFRESMIGRLYEQDASQLEHYRLVKEANQYSIVGGYADAQSGQVRAQNLLRLRGGWDQAANTSARLQQASFFGQPMRISQSEYVYDASVESSVKTYERVEGATITGEAEPNSSVQAFVELETGPGRTFSYAQTGTAGEDGQFELTVPYATTNELGPDDGYTNSSVEAIGGYTVRSIDGQSVSANATDVSVPEQAIYEGEEIEVELDSVEQGSGNESSNDTASGSAQSTSVTDASGSAPAASATSDAATSTSALEPGTAAVAAQLGASVETTFDALVARIAG